MSFLFLPAFILLSLFKTESLAYEKKDYLTSSQSVVEELGKKKKNLEQNEIKQKKALRILYQLNFKIKKIVKEKSKMQNAINELEAHLNETNRNISDLEVLIQKQKLSLAERLKIISKLGASQLLGFLVKSTSSAELERNLKILGLVIQKDGKSIKEFQNNSRQLFVEKEKLAERLNMLQVKNYELGKQEEKFGREQNFKQNIVNSLKKSHLFNLQKISELRKQDHNMSAEDKGLLEALLKPSFYEQKGNLFKPIEGKLTGSFGLEKDPIHSIQIQNHGVRFTAPEGTAVKSVFEGEVSFAGNLPGFGLTVIVDHGDHFYTVYANNKKIDVGEGQQITKHQMIAQSGIDTKTNLPGIYFEIRHFSEPDDPQKWMKGQIE